MSMCGSILTDVHKQFTAACDVWVYLDRLLVVAEPFRRRAYGHRDELDAEERSSKSTTIRCCFCDQWIGPTDCLC